MNGKKRLIVWSMAIVALILTGVWGYAGDLKLNMKKVLELGTTGEEFFQLDSVCEDDGENFYVLDGKKCNVRKFSKDGKELLNFGSRGEGPLEWSQPFGVFFSKQTGIIVTEWANFATISTTSGKLIKKINFAKKKDGLSNIKYIAGDIFYVVFQRMLRYRQQFLIDSSVNFLNSKLYTTTGGIIKVPNVGTIWHKNIELFPDLIFESYNDHAIAGLTDRYELKLLNSQGKVVRIIRRKVEGQRITEKEREYFSKLFLNDTYLSPPVKKYLVSLIPKNKMYFYTARPTSKYVFVFRIKPDTTTDKPPYPVDVFSITGEYRGEVSVHKLPLLVTDKYMYFEEGNEENEDESILLAKYSYELAK